MHHLEDRRQVVPNACQGSTGTLHWLRRMGRRPMEPGQRALQAKCDRPQGTQGGPVLAVTSNSGLGDACASVICDVASAVQRYVGMSGSLLAYLLRLNMRFLGQA